MHDDHLGEGGERAKADRNIEAVLKKPMQITFDRSMYGNGWETTRNAIPGAELSEQPDRAISNIHGRYIEQMIDESAPGERHMLRATDGSRFNPEAKDIDKRYAFSMKDTVATLLKRGGQK